MTTGTEAAFIDHTEPVRIVVWQTDMEASKNLTTTEILYTAQPGEIPDHTTLEDLAQRFAEEIDPIEGSHAVRVYAEAKKAGQDGHWGADGRWPRICDVCREWKGHTSHRLPAIRHPKQTQRIITRNRPSWAVCRQVGAPALKRKPSKRKAKIMKTTLMKIFLAALLISMPVGAVAFIVSETSGENGQTAQAAEVPSETAVVERSDRLRCDAALNAAVNAPKNRLAAREYRECVRQVCYTAGSQIARTAHLTSETSLASAHQTDLRYAESCHAEVWRQHEWEAGLM